MKVLEEATTPNGIKIYLEDWSDHNTTDHPDLYGLTISAYPIAKNSTYWFKSGEKFCLSMSMNKYSNYTNDNVKSDFEALKSGEKSLEDLSEHFWNGRKDKYLLGMIDNYGE